MPKPNLVHKRLSKRIDGYRDELVSFQQQLTEIQALSPENGGKGEAERARFLKTKLSEFGLTEVQEIDAADARVPGGIRPNLAIRLRGKKRSPTVWIMAHLDTVPPGDLKLWESDPFKAIVKNGKIFGRGTEDNQQGIVCPLFAMRALVEEQVVPPTDVALLLVSDEETGNTYGIDHVLKSAPTLVGKKDLVVVPDAGAPDGATIEVAEKSILWCEFVIKGKQVHASTPNLGINAHRAAAYLAVRLDERLHKAFSSKNDVFDPPESTFEPTRRDANVPNVNTIPGEERIFFDCRILPEYDIDLVIGKIKEVKSEVEKEFNVSISISYPNISRSAPATPVDAPVVLALSKAIREVRGVDPKPIGIGGGTVAALFRRHGTPAAVWSTIDDLAHQPNEYCTIENLVSDTKVFAHLFVR